MKWLLVFIMTTLPAFSGVAPAKVTTSSFKPVVKSTEITLYRTDLNRFILIRWGISEVPDFEDSEKQNTFEVKMAKDLISRRLFLIDALRKGITIDPEQVKTRIAEEVENKGGEKLFDAFLSRIKLTHEEYEKEIQGNLIAKKYIDELVAASNKSAQNFEADLLEAYEKEPDRYTRPERVHVRHIFRRFPANANQGQEEAILFEMHSIRDHIINSGADFAQLASSISDDPSGQYGGDLGYFARSEMEASFEKSAFSLKEGEISEPVKTRAGYHLIKLEQRIDADKGGLQQARERVINAVHDKRREEILNKTIRKLWDDAEVELLI